MPQWKEISSLYNIPLQIGQGIAPYYLLLPNLQEGAFYCQWLHRFLLFLKMHCQQYIGGIPP